MESVNLVLFFMSIVLIGMVRFFEGWKSFFICFGIWITIIGFSAMIMGSLNISRDDERYKVIGFIEFVILNIGYFLYLFKKGYLGIFICRK